MSRRAMRRPTSRSSSATWGAFDDADFAREALEAHFIVSRIVQAKSKWVAVAGVLTLAGMALAGAALVSRLLHG